MTKDGGGKGGSDLVKRNEGQRKGKAAIGQKRRLQTARRVIKTIKLHRRGL